MMTSRPPLYPPLVLDTLLTSEMGYDLEQVAKAFVSGGKPIDTLKDRHSLVYLLLPSKAVVKGWLATHLRCQPRTFWTWDKRFAVDMPFGGSMPGNVEPIGWWEIG